jgi:hypothetical protein
MRLDLLEGVRTLQWSGHHLSHASGITDTLNHVPRNCSCDMRVVGGEPGEPVLGGRCGVSILQRGQPEDLPAQVGG